MLLKLGNFQRAHFLEMFAADAVVCDAFET